MDRSSEILPSVKTCLSISFVSLIIGTVLSSPWLLIIWTDATATVEESLGPLEWIILLFLVVLTYFTSFAYFVLDEAEKLKG